MGLDALFEALGELDADPESSRATSVRLPTALHRATQLAVELGMDDSFTAATSEALRDRLTAFARREALAQHFSQFPADRPALSAVARRRVRGTEHPAADRPDLVDDVAAWIEGEHPDWWVSGAVDDTIDVVLSHVAMLAANVGAERRATA